MRNSTRSGISWSIADGTSLSDKTRSTYFFNAECVATEPTSKIWSFFSKRGIGETRCKPCCERSGTDLFFPERHVLEGVDQCHGSIDLAYRIRKASQAETCATHCILRCSASVASSAHGHWTIGTTHIAVLCINVHVRIPMSAAFLFLFLFACQSSELTETPLHHQIRKEALQRLLFVCARRDDNYLHWR